MSTTRFVKMHGLGNDFLVVDRRGHPDIPPEVVREVCDRHTGVGADGILAFLSEEAGPRMRVFNADGSVADMCGNGLRCFVRWLLDVQGWPAGELVVATDAGPHRCRPITAERRVVAVAVDLGVPRFSGRAEVVAAGFRYTGEDLFLGNPHFVVLRAPEPGELEERGPFLATHSHFPRGTNVEWLRVRSATEADLCVYERGVGITRACGTGGGAAAAVAVRLGLMAADADLRVSQPGGDLTYRIDASSVWMTGPAEHVFEGTWPREM